MSRRILFAAVLALSCGGVRAAVQTPLVTPRYWGAAPAEWTMDYDAALARAEAEDRWTIVMFTGAWWCPYCQGLERSVMTNEVWKAYAASNGLMLVTLDFNRRNNFNKLDPNNKCFLWNADYLAANSLTEADGDERLAYNYELQAAYTVPSQTRVPYPTWIVLRPDGSRAARLKVYNTPTDPPSTETVIRRFEQALLADPADELDDDARLFPTPLSVSECTEAEALSYTLSENDLADVFSFTATAGTEWVFEVTPTAGLPAVPLRLTLLGSGQTNVLEQVTLTPAPGAVYRYRTQQTVERYLQISLATPVTNVIGYTLSYTCAPYSDRVSVYSWQASLTGAKARARTLESECGDPETVCYRQPGSFRMKGFVYHYGSCTTTPELLLYFDGQPVAYSIRGGTDSQFQLLNLIGRKSADAEGYLSFVSEGFFAFSAAGFGRAKEGELVELKGQLVGQAAPRPCAEACEEPVPSVAYPACEFAASVEAWDVMTGSWTMRYNTRLSERVTVKDLRLTLAAQLPKTVTVVVEDGQALCLGDWVLCD